MQVVSLLIYIFLKKYSILLKDKKHLALSELEISRLGALIKVLKDTSHYHSSKLADIDIAVLLRLIKSWPITMIFPGWHARPLTLLHVVHNFYCVFSC